MTNKQIEVLVRLDSSAFQDFALFDAFRLRKRWRNPLLFAAIFTVSAVICFAMRSSTNQAVLLGSVLLAVGLGVPLIYFFMFFRSVKAQAAKMRLGNARYVYTVALGEKGFTLTTASSPAKVTKTDWGNAFGAWKAAGCIYLYSASNQACLLPAGQANVKDEALWAFLQQKLGQEKCHIVK